MLRFQSVAALLLKRVTAAAHHQPRLLFTASSSVSGKSVSAGSILPAAIVAVDDISLIVRSYSSRPVAPKPGGRIRDYGRNRNGENRGFVGGRERQGDGRERNYGNRERSGGMMRGDQGAGRGNYDGGRDRRDLGRRRDRDDDEPVKNTIGGITVASAHEGYCYGCGAELVPPSDNSEAGRNAIAEGSLGTIEKPKSFHAMNQENYKKGLFRNWALCPRCEYLRDVEEGGGDDSVMDLAPDNKMTAIFREEVSKVRRQKDAVVILCVDAVNVNGTLLNKIRNYVGGNPILLAVTRCDLLPAYVWKGRRPEAIKEIFRERAKEMVPAEIYLCSEAKNVMREIGGIKQLAHDLWNNLNGRDPYVIGCANIGKSTLTDILVSGFMTKGEQLGHFDAFLDRKRLEALERTRITKSALPGTTLANVRVPCFKNHLQALWDTPGLMVDDSHRQLPIRNLKQIRMKRPQQVKPHIYVERERRSFALLLMEKGDNVPLMRFEIRLKKNAEGEGPIRVVWNSILELESKIVDIDEARQDELNRQEELPGRAAMDQEEYEKAKFEKDEIARELGLLKAEGENEEKNEEEKQELTPEEIDEEKNRRKELKKQIFLEWEKRQKEKLGEEEYNRQAAERTTRHLENQRFRALSSLEEIHEVIVERNYGLDIAIANFGWLGVLMPRTAMIKVFSPNTGMKIGHYDTLALPMSWGSYKSSVNVPVGHEEEQSQDDEEDDEWEGGGSYKWNKPKDEDDEMVFLDGPGGQGEEIDDEYALLHGDQYGEVKEDKDDFGFANPIQFGKSNGNVRERDADADMESDSQDDTKKDAWESYKGEKVGWMWDYTTRWVAGKLEVGWNPIPEKWGGKDIRSEFRRNDGGSENWQRRDRRSDNWQSGKRTSENWQDRNTTRNSGQDGDAGAEIRQGGNNRSPENRQDANARPAKAAADSRSAL